MEKNHKDGLSRDDAVKLTIKSLLEVVQTGAKNIEIAIMEPGGALEMLDTEKIEAYVKDIENEKQEEAARRPGRGGAASGAAGSASLPTRGPEA